MKSPELTIVVQNDYTVWARREDGAEVRGKFVLDSLHRSLIKIFVDWLNCSKISHRQELEVFGSLLYRTVFDSNVDAFFKHHLKSIQKDAQRLRLQLSFEESVDNLASIPWEYLYSPDTETERGFFLATNKDLVLSRYMPLNIARKTLGPAREALRVLIVESKPQKLDTITPFPITEAIQKLEGLYAIVIDKLRNPTIDNFLDKIEKFKPHVVHFIGHGRFNKQAKRGEIALLDADEENAIWVGDEVFTDFFDQKRAIPHLVFLHLCEGGVVDFDANYAGLAPKLVRAGIQAVVAMQYPVTNKHANVFSLAFYNELAKEEPVDNAVQIGRWNITLRDDAAYDSGAFGTPVLYMRSRDGIIRSQARSISRRKELRGG